MEHDGNIKSINYAVPVLEGALRVNYNKTTASPYQVRIYDILKAFCQICIITFQKYVQRNKTDCNDSHELQYSKPSYIIRRKKKHHTCTFLPS